MGASAGAGSGEFDIYRGCRRRELIRQEYLTEKSGTDKSSSENNDNKIIRCNLKKYIFYNNKTDASSWYRLTDRDSDRWMDM